MWRNSLTSVCGVSHPVSPSSSKGNYGHRSFIGGECFRPIQMLSHAPTQHILHANAASSLPCLDGKSIPLSAGRRALRYWELQLGAPVVALAGQGSHLAWPGCPMHEGKDPLEQKALERGIGQNVARLLPGEWTGQQLEILRRNARMRRNAYDETHATRDQPAWLLARSEHHPRQTVADQLAGREIDRNCAFPDVKLGKFDLSNSSRARVNLSKSGHASPIFACASLRERWPSSCLP